VADPADASSRGDPSAERSRLAEGAYRTSASLRDRAALYRFARRQVDLPGWVFDHVQLRERGRFLDVGCGPGWYLRTLSQRRPDWSLCGVDLSLGMAAEARRHGPTMVADAQQLPAVDRAFDLVLAAHMLYHVPDPERAAAELARVCLADGYVLVVLNGPGHQLALRQLVESATGTRLPLTGGRMQLDRAPEVLAPHLVVEREDVLVDDIVVTSAGPVISYVQSMRSLVEPGLRGFTNWTMVLARCRAALDEALARDGQWTTSLETGVLVCRPADT
jgi:SAM-dependent methyltransferase